ncbi:MAG: DUF2231 domain-containing protein [Bacteroidota bacterium]
MNELPGMWRTELWHVMLVHFPIVLLPGAALLRVLSRFITDKHSGFLLKASRLSLVVGVIFAWIAVYTGSLADSIVVRDLCDPTVLEDHENSGYTVGVLFTIAALIDIGAMKFLAGRKRLVKKLTEWIVLLILLAGSGYVAYTAHLGASMVYQQGAAVYMPSSDCSEFE